jgi:hypothetical protein
MQELLKWLQGVGVGVLVEIVEYVNAVRAGLDTSVLDFQTLLQIAVLAALVRVAGLAVSKIGPAVTGA